MANEKGNIEIDAIMYAWTKKKNKKRQRSDQLTWCRCTCTVTPALPRALGAAAGGTIVAATGCSRSSTSDDVTAASWTI
jgi:hypothetical protein